jgi:hypothetical protein
METMFFFEDLKGKDSFGNPCISGKIILKCILEKLHSHEDISWIEVAQCGV